MANPHKQKGDRAERAYVAHALEDHPGITRADAMRYLGAGRKDDVGDVRVYPGVSVQVKHWNNVTAALIEGAQAARRQRHNGNEPYGVAMVKVPQARPPRPVWLASALLDEWPLPVPDEAPIFRRSSRMLGWLAATSDTPAVARARATATTKRARAQLPPEPQPDPALRVALLVVGDKTYAVSPEDAWIRSYRAATGPLSATGAVAGSAAHA